jgi:sulfur-oxidizing protein SoxX
MLLVVMAGMTAVPTQAAGQAPDPKTCNDSANPSKDAVTQGGCIAISRTKGNCQACHFVAGITSGNIAPPLVGMAQRFPDRARLRAQLQDATQANPKTVMPPYGRHEILTPQEIDQVIEWLLTL